MAGWKTAVGFNASSQPLDGFGLCTEVYLGYTSKKTSTDIR